MHEPRKSDTVIRVVRHRMNARRVVGWLLVGFAALLTYAQTVAVFRLMEHQVDGFDFPRRYALESSIEYYGIAVVTLTVGILVLRSSARAVAWVALAVALGALWLMVGRELWLHYFELPRRYAHFRERHPPYFTGTLWMFTPRFLWHLILPVTAVLSALYVFRTRRENDDCLSKREIQDITSLVMKQTTNHIVGLNRESSGDVTVWTAPLHEGTNDVGTTFTVRNQQSGWTVVNQKGESL